MKSKLRIMPKPPRRKASRVGFSGKRPRRHAVTAVQFRDARVFAGFTRQGAADFLGVSLRTIGHWETGKARPVFAAFKLLRVYRHGDLIDPRWSGYRLVRGKLVTPENHEFAPADMVWLSLLVRRAHAFGELLAQRNAARSPLGTGAGARLSGGRDASSSSLAPAGVLLLSSGAMPRRSTLPATVPEMEHQAQVFGSYQTPKPPKARQGGYEQLWNGGRLSPCSNTGKILAGGAV